MKGHLTKNLEFFVSSRWFPFLWLYQCCLQFKYGYVFAFLFVYFLISFLHIPYPACRHTTSFFLSPYLFPELFYTVLRWCFFYHNLAFLYFSIEFFGIYLEDFILPAEFVTFIKLSFHLCFCLYSLLQFLFDTSNINVICDLILSYSIPGFSCVWIFIPFYFAKYQISPVIVSICFSILVFPFGFLFLSVLFSFLV